MSRRRTRDTAGTQRAPKKASLTRKASEAIPSRGDIRPPALVVNGWTLLFWTEFRDRWSAILAEAKAARTADPIGYRHAAAVKFLRTVRDLVFQEIPQNPDHPQFR